jgi:hypothetical protein
LPGASSAKPWFCDRPGTFAHRTCVERWPEIVDRIAADNPGFAGALAALRTEIAGGVVAALSPSNAERARWADVDPFVGGPWTALPWYVGESFLYARVREAVGFARDGRDPFLPAKLREEAALGDAVDDDDLDRLLLRALWGNRADLSLREAMAHTSTGDDDLLVDDRAAVVARLQRAQRVGILLDNAAVELAADLALARALRRRGVHVTLFAKDAPFFVSDATVADVARLAARGHDTGGSVVVADPFFTGPAFYACASLARGLAPAAHAALVACDLVVSKGDCNYRRLVADRPWHSADGAAFDDVVDFPVPVVALRTLKAEVMVGAPPDRVAAAIARDPAWLVSGRFGVVQLAARPATAHASTTAAAAATAQNSR